MEFQIVKVKNGYAIFDEYGPAHMRRGSPWVFETLDNALEWLRSKFTSHEIETGSEPAVKENKE